MSRELYDDDILLCLLLELAEVDDDTLELMMVPPAPKGTFQTMYQPFLDRLKAKSLLPSPLPWRYKQKGFARQNVRILTSASKSKDRLYGVKSDDVQEEYKKVLERVSDILSNKTLLAVDEAPDAVKLGGPPPPPPPPSAGAASAV